MPQMHGRHKCGHVQRYCPRCHHTGCDQPKCPECIGGNNSQFCAMCGDVHTVDMRHYQINRRQQALALEHKDKGIQIRLKALEKSTGVHYNSANHAVTQGIPTNQGTLLGKLFGLGILMLVCHFLTAHGLTSDRFDDGWKFVVMAVNALGFCGELLIKIATGIFSQFV